MRKLLLLALITSSLSAWQTATVQRIIDGDTIMIKTSQDQSRKVRLIGFDTPESFLGKKMTKQARACSVTISMMRMAGNIAKRYTATRLKKGSKIHFIDFGEDYFHRGLIWVKGFNYRIVQDGFAKAYRRADLPRSIKEKLKEAEKEARKADRGVWSLFADDARCY